MQQRGIRPTVPSATGTRRRIGEKIPVQEIIDRYVIAGETARAIADDYGLNERYVFRLLARHDIPRRGTRKVLPLSNGEIARRYVEGRVEIQAMAAELGVSRHTIAKRLNEARVQRPVGHRGRDLPDAEIAARHDAGESARALAAEFGVSHSTILKRVARHRDAEQPQRTNSGSQSSR
ncbi:helix-turn-helix domain-containing protein [Streptomyces sp. NBC_00390]|uniref:helix-turn-helix domain-containing protein n=1 Tax=Streptomyces sp. NBC_00390 TaxID=2975736 RepID=UPI002E222073